MSEELSNNFETLQLHAGYVFVFPFILGSDGGAFDFSEAVKPTAAIEFNATSWIVHEAFN
jgi:hypothetical protein